MKQNLAVGRLVFAAVLVILFSASVCAADVAYIYKSESKIDENVLAVFENMNLSVQTINERDTPSSWDSYKFIYIGDERIKVSKIPFGKMPVVLMSRYNGKAFGIADRDGMSRLGATAPLSVVKDESEFQVYTSAFDKRRVSVPYFYLADCNKAKSSQTMASTTRPNSKNKRGDVVAYFAPGAKLENGKIMEEKACFFGIVESEYWTDSAEELFKECVGYVIGESIPGVCSSNSDCGTNEFIGERFCESGNVIRKFRSYVCSNPGSTESSCSYSEENKVVEDCVGECIGGNCIQQSGGTHNVALINVTNLVGPIRIQDSDGKDLLVGESILCNEKYKIIIRAKNLGNYTENVTFAGGTEGLEIEHSGVEELEEGKASDRTKTVNFTLEEGNYELSFEAVINGYTDSNPLDNIAKRTIHVSCGGASACSVASDCGTDGFVGNEFCLSNNVGKKYRIFSCGEGGICSFVDEDRVIENCQSGCSAGACGASTNLIHDIGLINVTNAAGLIRIQTTGGVDVPATAPLHCNEKYKIIIKPKNFGNYTENVTFVGNVGSLEIDYSGVVLEAGEAGSTKTKTLNLSLQAGSYNMRIEAVLNGAADNAPSNNVATKEVTVNC